jgi:hypothetical protein
MRNEEQQPKTITTTTNSIAVLGNFGSPWTDRTQHCMAQLTKTPRLSLRLHIRQAIVLHGSKLSSSTADGQNQAQKMTEKKGWLGIRFNMMQLHTISLRQH